MYRLIILAVTLCSFLPASKPGKKFLPPGTTQVNDSLFVDIHEVTQQSWAEYRFWLKKEYGANSGEYQKSAIDSTVWLFGGMTSNEPFTRQHQLLRHYKNYPVVGVSYEQALAYCTWRTKHILRQLPGANQEIPRRFEYRLPTEAEWQAIAGNAMEIYKHKDKIKITKYPGNTNSYQARLAANSYVSDTLNQYTCTMPVGGYKKNRYGCYDVIGNVSEMVAEKGISKGGGWQQTLDESHPEKRIYYDAPKAWLGFRCVCILN